MFFHITSTCFLSSGRSVRTNSATGTSTQIAPTTPRATADVRASDRVYSGSFTNSFSLTPFSTKNITTCNYYHFYISPSWSSTLTLPHPAAWTTHRVTLAPHCPHAQHPVYWAGALLHTAHPTPYPVIQCHYNDMIHVYDK